MQNKRQEMHEAIIAVLNSEGPLLGKELLEKLPSPANHIDVWNACFSSDSFQISHFARYYLRYDITREDYIRLSPSILRDFLSFTLISLPHQRREVIERQIVLSNHHRDISIHKLNLARRALIGIESFLPRELQDDLCAFVAGDITYFLGHMEPRECASTGKIVRGSDIDIVVVHKDDFPAEYVEKIESHLLAQKHLFLKDPAIREEIDFVCKPQSRMRGQFAYGDIHEKIACKILYESIHLFGSASFYFDLYNGLEKFGVKQKIEEDFLRAMKGRNTTIVKLLTNDGSGLSKSEQGLFFFSEERVEFT